MPSAARKRAITAKKTNAKSAAARKDSQTTNAPQAAIPTKVPEFLPYTNADGQTIHSYVASNGATVSITEAPLPAKWFHSEGRLANPEDKDGDMLGFVTDHGQGIYKSLASAFERDGEDIDPFSVYNAADSRNPFHAEWLEYNQPGEKEYAPAAVPLTLQIKNAEDEEKRRLGLHVEEYSPSDESSSPSEFSRGSSTGDWKARGQRTQKECDYWPLGKCRNGDKCRFLHLPEKAPKGRWEGKGGQNNVCWDWKKGTCRRGIRCGYDHFEYWG